jgi:hypothetical protein
MSVKNFIIRQSYRNSLLLMKLCVMYDSIYKETKILPFSFNNLLINTVKYLEPLLLYRCQLDILTILMTRKLVPVYTF